MPGTCPPILCWKFQGGYLILYTICIYIYICVHMCTVIYASDLSVAAPTRTSCVRRFYMLLHHLSIFPSSTLRGQVTNLIMNSAQTLRAGIGNNSSDAELLSPWGIGGERSQGNDPPPIGMRNIKSLKLESVSF